METMKILGEVRAIPEKENDRKVVFVASTALVTLTLLTPATAMFMVVALGQKIPVLLAATEYKPGSPTVPAGNASACSVKELRAPALNVTVMLLAPVAGGLVNNRVVF